MTDSVYHKLRPEERTIRLLILEPAYNSSHPLRARLQPASLNNHPEYDALSYVWGGPDKSSRIELSFGHACVEVAITDNLHAALGRLRTRDEAIALWVDALCINQDDVTERNSQVAMMASIYSRAAMVIAFFHEEVDDVGVHPIDFIQAVSAQPAHHIMPGAAPYILESLQENVSNPAFGLLQFFRAQWWKRVWTVQEAMLATRLKIVYGARELDFQDLLVFYNAFLSHIHSCCRDFNPIPGVLIIPSIERFMSMAQDLVWYRSSYVLSPGSFLELVGTFRYRNATNLRDKIYGLSALSRLPAGFVDYSLSAPEVYTRHAVMTMRDSKNLDLWSHLFTMDIGDVYLDGELIRVERLANLPSWVPDWSLTFKTAASDVLKRRCQFTKAFKVFSEAEMAIEYLPPDKLRLKGHHFDKVKKVGPPNLEPNYFPLDLVTAWEEVAGIGESQIPETSHIKNRNLYRAFRLAMTWDLSSNDGFPHSLSDFPDNRLGESYIKDLQRADDHRDRFLYGFWRHSELYIEEQDYEAHKLLVQSISQLDIDQYRGMIITMTLGKRFLVTESGRLGFGPAETEVGDDVYCFYGGRTPYILRGSQLSGSRILGDAYIKGAMDGWIVDLGEDDSRSFESSEVILL